MNLISKTESEIIIKLTIEEYENLLTILDQSTLSEHRRHLKDTKTKMWCDLYDMDLD